MTNEQLLEAVNEQITDLRRSQGATTIDTGKLILQAKIDALENLLVRLGLMDVHEMSWCQGDNDFCEECGGTEFTESGECAGCLFNNMASDGMIDADPGDIVSVGAISFTY